MKKIALLLFLSADVLFGQAIYNPANVFFPQIAVGGEAGGQNYVTLVQIVNNNSSATTGLLSLFADSGAPLSAVFDGQGPQASASIVLESGQTRQIQITSDGPVTAGWMQVSYSPSDALTAVILQFRSGSTLLSEVGVEPGFGTILSTDFAAETDGPLNTGIAVVNPGRFTANIQATLWDAVTGDVLAGTHLSLPPNGHVARFLTELFPAQLNGAKIRAKVSLDSCSSASCEFIGGEGLLATAVRLNGDQFTTIPVAERPEGGDATRILPHVAFGGPSGGLNMKTVVYLTTNVPTGVFGTAEIFDDRGNPLPASADGARPSASITFTVPGNRVSRVVLSSDEDLTTGWIRLKLSGSVHLIASAVFQVFSGSILVSEAGVLDSPAVTRGLIYVKSQPGVANVGVALANNEPAPKTITLDLFDETGFVAATRNITLPANGHFAQFVTEIFTDLSGVSVFNGALSIHGAASFSALALRLSADKIATLPVAADGIYRPHIATVRITNQQRSPAQVSFEIDVRDYDGDIVVGSSTDVSAFGLFDFGTSGVDYGTITMNGAGLVNRQSGTLSGGFQFHITGALPVGTSANCYFVVYDSAGNVSNVVSIPIRF